MLVVVSVVARIAGAMVIIIKPYRGIRGYKCREGGEDLLQELLQEEGGIPWGCLIIRC